MTKDERIGLIIVRELGCNLKPENMGRLVKVARQREINEKGADIYVSATLIALLGYSYDTLQDMATNEQHQEDNVQARHHGIHGRNPARVSTSQVPRAWSLPRFTLFTVPMSPLSTSRGHCATRRRTRPKSGGEVSSNRARLHGRPTRPTTYASHSSHGHRIVQHGIDTAPAQ